jgi:hypothetical protein
MIINLLALLVILATGAVAGVLFTIRYAEHRHAGLQAATDRLAERELLTPCATPRDRLAGQRESRTLDPSDRLPT